MSVAAHRAAPPLRLLIDGNNGTARIPVSLCHPTQLSFGSAT